jgi:restriction system protein
VVAEIFYATLAPLVDSVVFNGFVSARDRATGQPVRPCVISLVATRELMDGLVLDEPELDPVLCLAHLHAIVSPHPYDLEPVKPVTYFDPTKYKLIDELGAVAGLDHRLDLLSLSSVEFEYLIRRLFEAVGMKSWVKNTRASKDEGVARSCTYGACVRVADVRADDALTWASALRSRSSGPGRPG